jgi:hypothetical protein
MKTVERRGKRAEQRKRRERNTAVIRFTPNDQSPGSCDGLRKAHSTRSRARQAETTKALFEAMKIRFIVNPRTLLERYKDHLIEKRRDFNFGGGLLWMTVTSIPKKNSRTRDAI